MTAVVDFFLGAFSLVLLVQAATLLPAVLRRADFSE